MAEMSTHRLFFSAMASPCEVCLAAHGRFSAQALAKIAVDEVCRIEAKYSRYRPDSVVSTINAQAGQQWLECDDETLLLLDHADALFEHSGGLFDVTSGVLRHAWNFDQAQLPQADVLEDLCALVNWPSVQRDGRHLRLPLAGMELDFGGFGKEYAADRAAEALLTQGIRHGYINLAGDVRVMGPRPDGQPWTIGVRDPRTPDRLLASIALAAGSVATSGDYERYFELDARRYCHILDPQSGQPVACWRSVSVFSASAMEAGGLATIAMLMQEKALAFLEEENVLFLAVDHAGKQYGKNTR